MARSRAFSLVSAVSSLSAVTLVACTVMGVQGCRADAGSADPTVLAAGSGDTLGPKVDSAKMMAAIEHLASDELQGRFTLDPQIEEAAGWIAGHHTALGLVPPPKAESMRVSYGLLIDVEPEGEQRLAVGGKAVDAERFVARGEGRSGEAKGELVFAGYAAQWQPSDQPEVPPIREGVEIPKPTVAGYDDLAGLELQGKVALILDATPNTPDLARLFATMRSIAEDFDAKVGPLREAEDIKGLEALHRDARERLAVLVGGYIDVSKLGDDYWKVEDPKANFDIQMAAMAFMEQAMANPQFNPAEHGLAKKLERLAAAGAVGVVMVRGPRSEPDPGARERDALGDANERELSNHPTVMAEPGPLPLVQLSWREADRLFDIGGERLSEVQAAIDSDYTPRSTPLGVEVDLHTELKETRVDVPNVVAMLPGKTDEIVLIGAHFDHIGNDESGDCRAVVRRGQEPDTVCNGADDNASGTAMIMDLARGFAERAEATGEPLERTLVFAHFSGEELGLLGSRALAENAPFDMDEVVAMVNLDMVGRLGPQGLAVGGIYSSEQWMPLLDEVGNHGMRILYEGGTTTRSDHAHWFRRQTPVLFFFTGVHPDYHRAGDEIDEIDVEGLGSIGQLVSDLVFRLGEGYAIEWGELGPGEGIGRGLPGDDESTIVKVVGADGQPL
ncbi:probable aminopeptidase [Plesiocystis pacifica SIR-1]|uniref:Probable aminopeptidase n=1 Tax=Plesiocystis pacifica SIR-1 TaxID=391625 RepID=A6GF91_9BACT|nr:M28 family peptidase [Plesiocystis pacifica]EDM75488.1 probable aminopeptidase [Plesiocystis pacifica SIR-1]